MKKEAQKGRAGLRAAVLITLMLAGAALWFFGPTEAPAPETNAPTATPAPTADARASREAAYERDVAALEALVANEALGAATREQAAGRLSQMAQEHQQALGIERALEGAGYGVSVVLVQNGALTVVMSAPDISAEASAAILALCAAHTDIGAENISIMAGP